MGEVENAAERHYINCIPSDRHSFISGAKWQEKKMYSEDEVLDIIYSYRRWGHHGKEDEFFIDVWFEQFKKK
jgi:hypothetical protein